MYDGFQNEIYLSGLGGERPEFPLTFEGWERSARELLSTEAFAYVAGGAGDEQTMRANRAAFERYGFVPRMLREFARCDLATTLFGRAMPTPLLLAPIGVLELVAADGDIAVAHAAAKWGVTSVLSTVSSVALERVAESAPAAARWFQLYFPKNAELARSLVQRAEAAGCGAIVVTLDTWTLGWRPRDLALAHLPFLRAKGLANYLSDPVFRSRLGAPPESSAEALQAAVAAWTGLYGNPALTWSDVARIRSWTSLPIVLKGICGPDDARAAVDAGAAGVIVSNHGGRQVDCARAALDCLPAVAEAVGERAAVLFDSGIRSGADAMIALGLGADAVLVGRPYVYGLAFGGERGVEWVLRCLLAELATNLALAGFPSAAAAKNALR
ncbi:MAG: alpha-hydroxy-acid oxidizing protein [Vulcanimicrobiaceae bacterium]